MEFLISEVILTIHLMLVSFVHWKVVFTNYSINLLDEKQSKPHVKLCGVKLGEDRSWNIL